MQGLVLQNVHHFPILFDFKCAVPFSDMVTRQLDVWLKVLTATSDPKRSDIMNTDTGGMSDRRTELSAFEQKDQSAGTRDLLSNALGRQVVQEQF